MYIFKNAWLSIRRNKGRNILIGVIILAISCACAITLAIKNSATNLINSYEEQYEVTATIGVNRSSLMQNMQQGDSSTGKEDMKEKFSNIPSITEEDVNTYGDSTYVSSYYYTSSIGLNSSNIEKASSTSSTNTSSETSSKMPDTNDKKGNIGEMGSSTDFKLVGYSSLEAMTDFISGTYTVTEGSVDTDFEANSCVVNSELATYNNLSVGDTITLVDPNDSSITYDLVVTGIFTDNEESTGMNMFSNSVNSIITNVTTVNNIVTKDTTLIKTVTPTFVLTSKDVVDSFTSEVTDKGLSEYLTVSTNLDEVSEATSSISSLSTYATTFLIITLIIGVVILLIINMINIRERKYEIGVLRTIGMKKSLLTGQFLVELLTVSIIAMTLGTGIGALVSVPTANKLLANEISSSQEKVTQANNNFGPGSSTTSGSSSTSGTTDSSKQKPSMSKVNGVANVTQIKSINAVVNFKVVMEMLLIGIGITLVSGLSAMISIERFSPLTILKERS